MVLFAILAVNRRNTKSVSNKPDFCFQVGRHKLTAFATNEALNADLRVQGCQKRKKKRAWLLLGMTCDRSSARPLLCRCERLSAVRIRSTFAGQYLVQNLKQWNPARMSMFDKFGAPNVMPSAAAPQRHHASTLQERSREDKRVSRNVSKVAVAFG